jgi:hypothetical protein
MLLVPEIEKGCDLGVGLQKNVSTFAAIAPVGAAPRDKFFTPEANAPVPSVSRFDEDLRFINKFDRWNSSDP